MRGVSVAVSVSPFRHPSHSHSHSHSSLVRAFTTSITRLNSANNAIRLNEFIIEPTSMHTINEATHCHPHHHHHHSPHPHPAIISQAKYLRTHFLSSNHTNHTTSSAFTETTKCSQNVAMSDQSSSSSSSSAETSQDGTADSTAPPPSSSSSASASSSPSSSSPSSSSSTRDNLKPSALVCELDRWIIGQNEAKKAVAVAMRNRWRRHKLPKDIRDDVMPKNIL